MTENELKLEQIKDKLRKLIAKEASARDIGNLAEAEAFAAKIQQLMIEYELEMDDLAGGASQRVYNVGQERFDTSSLTGSHESNWVAILYCYCGKSSFCKVVLSPMRGEKAPLWITIYGDPTNRELLHFMVAQLVVKLKEVARIAFKKYKEYDDGQDKRNTYFRGFYRGACVGVRDKLTAELKKEEDARPQVHGLVLNKMAAVQKYLEDNGIRFGRAGQTRTSSSSGYQDGYSAGRSVNINKGVKGGSTTSKYLGF